MRNKILAIIGKDDGQTIRYGGGLSFKVGPDTCEDCGKPAEVIVQGETDSYGFETCALCRPCNEKVETSISDLYDGANVEDREGHFLISECSNYDKGSAYDWTRYFTSLKEAVGYYRRIEDQAAHLGGLYPGNGVQEVDRALRISYDDEGYDSVEGKYEVLKKYAMWEFLGESQPEPPAPEILAAAKAEADRIAGIFDKKELGPIVPEDEVVTLPDGRRVIEYNPYQKLNGLRHHMQARRARGDTSPWSKDPRWELKKLLSYITEVSARSGHNAEYSTALKNAVRALSALQSTVSSETERDACIALKAIRPFW